MEDRKNVTGQTGEQLASSDMEDQKDFSSQYSDNLPGILQALNISLAITSYDAHRLILIRAQDNQINTQLEYFPRPMGLYVDEQTMTLGTLTQVINFKRTDFFLPQIKQGFYDNVQVFGHKLVETRPDKVKEYLANRDEKLNELKQADSLYSQRALLSTGRINIHDIAWGRDRLWILNTAFSSLCSLDPDYNFVVHWKPDFISELRPEDRCHLNGMAMVGGKPKYVTTCGIEDVKDAWYERELNGTVIDIDSNEILTKGLYMPHSPRVHGDYLYVCESGMTRILRMHIPTREFEVFKELPGFCRGMCFFGELLLVGLSVIRESGSRNRMPCREYLDPKDTFCGVWLLDAATGQKIADITFTGDVNQIYDIAVIPNGHFAAMTTSIDVLNQHLFDYVEENL